MTNYFNVTVTSHLLCVILNLRGSLCYSPCSDPCGSCSSPNPATPGAPPRPTVYTSTRTYTHISLLTAGSGGNLNWQRNTSVVHSFPPHCHAELMAQCSVPPFHHIHSQLAFRFQSPPASMGRKKSLASQNPPATTSLPSSLHHEPITTCP